MAAGLLLILRIYIRASCWMVSRNATFGLLELDLYLVFRQKLACDDLQMLVAHTITEVSVGSLRH